MIVNNSKSIQQTARAIRLNCQTHICIEYGMSNTDTSGELIMNITFALLLTSLSVVPT